MPQGVEHQQKTFTPSTRWKVQESLMPQGVEHPSKFPAVSEYLSAGIIDAARR